MANAAYFVKDPAAVLDYQWNWAAWLATDEVIATSTVTAPTGITVDSESNTTTAATVWLSGGTEGQTYLLVNRITTDQGRTDERTLTVFVADR